MNINNPCRQVSTTAAAIHSILETSVQYIPTNLLCSVTGLTTVYTIKIGKIKRLRTIPILQNVLYQEYEKHRKYEVRLK